MPPTPPPDIDIEVWGNSIEFVRRWQPATLLVTHYGAHENPPAHLDALLTHLEAASAMARRSLDVEGTDDDRLNAFADEMRIYLQRHIPQNEADLYGYAAPIDQCWLGLARYWRKRGVGVQA